MWIVIFGIDTYDCSVKRFHSRKEAIQYMNKFTNPGQLILAVQEPVKLEIDKGKIVVK